MPGTAPNAADLRPRFLLPVVCCFLPISELGWAFCLFKKKTVPLRVGLKSTKRRHTKGFFHTSVRVLELKNLRRGCTSTGSAFLLACASVQATTLAQTHDNTKGRSKQHHHPQQTARLRRVQVPELWLLCAWRSRARRRAHPGPRSHLSSWHEIVRRWIIRLWVWRDRRREVHPSVVDGAIAPARGATELHSLIRRLRRRCDRRTRRRRRRHRRRPPP